MISQKRSSFSPCSLKQFAKDFTVLVVCYNFPLQDCALLYRPVLDLLLHLLLCIYIDFLQLHYVDPGNLAQALRELNGLCNMVVHINNVNIIHAGTYAMSVSAERYPASVQNDFSLWIPTLVSETKLFHSASYKPDVYTVLLLKGIIVTDTLNSQHSIVN